MQIDALRERIPYHGALLALFTLLTSAALLTANHATLPAIERAAQEDLKASLAQVLPDGLTDNDLLKDVLRVDDNGVERLVYRGTKSGGFTAAVFGYSGRGYAGEIKLLIGVDASGTVMGVRVLKHAETPGLGDKIEVAKSDWIRSFEKKSLDNTPLAGWAVKKDGGGFDQFAGATITPRAVVKAVKEGLQFYAAHREAIAGGGK